MLYFIILLDIAVQILNKHIHGAAAGHAVPGRHIGVHGKRKEAGFSGASHGCCLSDHLAFSQTSSDGAPDGSVRQNQHLGAFLSRRGTGSPDDGRHCRRFPAGGDLLYH